MAIQIKAPDGSIAQFPDGTPDQTIQSVMAKTFGGPSGGMDMAAAPPTHGQMMALSMSEPQRQAYLANTNPHMSTMEDVGRSAVSGAQQGLGGTIGQFGDYRDLVGNAFHSAINWGGHALHVPQSAIDATEHGVNSVENLQMRALLPGLDAAPTSSQVNSGIQGVTGPYHQPQTVPGAYARTVASMWPAAAGGAGPVSAVAIPVASGLASEAAGQATHRFGPKVEHVARIVGALGGGGAVSGIVALAKSAPKKIAEAAPNLTDAQAQDAADLMRHAESIGSPITLPEAVQQVTGGATNLGRTQRIIEGTKKGQAAMADLLSQRSPNARNAATRYADTIAPPTDQPSMIGVNAQKAATGALDKARQDVNAVAQPSYDALPGQTMDPAQYAAVSANPSYAIALKALRSDPELGPALKGLPDNDISVVNAVVKRLGTTGEQAKGTPMAPGDNELAAARFSAKAQADAAARAASPDYANARDTVSNLSAQQVDPLKAGPTGAISATDQVPTQTGALYPTKPLAGAPAETVQAIQALRGQNPQVPPDLLRQHLLNTLEGTTSDLTQGGISPYAGFKYAKAIAGSPEQARVLNAGVAETSGPAAAEELQRNLQVFQAQGMRQPPGSLTAQNMKDYADLGMSIPGDLVHSANPLHWPKALGNMAYNAATKARVDQLIKVIKANPDEAAALLAQARQQGQSSGLTGPLLAGAIAGNGR